MALPQPDIPRPYANAAEVVEFLRPLTGSVIKWIKDGDEETAVVTGISNHAGSPYVTVMGLNHHGLDVAFDWDLTERVYLVADPAGQPYEEVDW